MNCAHRRAALQATVVAGVFLMILAPSAAAQASRALVRALERRAAERAVRHEAMSVLRRDAARDAGVAATTLNKNLTTHRYVTGKKLLPELQRGLRPGAHTSSRALPGRPPNAATAQRIFGLPERPAWRLRIEWPKGWPVRKAKALGGRPGVGEITSRRALPRSAVKGAIRLR